MAMGGGPFSLKRNPSSHRLRGLVATGISGIMIVASALFQFENVPVRAYGQLSDLRNHLLRTRMEKM